MDKGLEFEHTLEIIELFMEIFLFFFFQYNLPPKMEKKEK
jgi:hypothetical protein